MSGESIPLAVIGLNYKSAAIEVRERMAFGPERIPLVLRELTGKKEAALGPIEEAAILCTCNRTEVFLKFNDLERAHKQVRDVLAEYSGTCSPQLDQVQYALHGEEAVLHLMRVASGLESLVLGENEILGQVRSAAALAQSAGCSGPVLSALFRTAIVAGKRAHRETSLGSEGISVANLVVEMAEEMMGALDERTALLVGAGKISSMTARALTGAGLRWILVSNRTFERAQKLAQQLRGQAVHFDALEASLAQADIVICSTSAPHTVLHADEVQRAQERRHGRPMLIADLAVPRDADPDIDLIEGVQLVNIDGLESAMKRHHMKMNAACQQAEDISRQETQAFCRWFEERRCSAVIEALYHRAEAIYSAEAQHALSRMGPLSERQERAVQAMAKAIAGKLLHAPVTRLHELSAEKKIGSYLELTRDLYDLP